MKPANGPRRKLSLRLPIEGWCMVLTMLLIGMAALNTAAPLLYMVFAMMCAFFILSGLLSTNTLTRITIVRNAPQVWIAQETLPVEIIITNIKRMTSSHSLHVRDLFDEKQVAGAVFFPRVPSRGGSVRQQYMLRFARRGIYRLEEVEVGTRFPFGLIERAFTWDLFQEFLILPQTIPVDSVMEQAKSELGDFESQRKGQGSSLYGLRPYSPEISARDIHWKISARRGTLIAREFESEDRRRATVMLDNRVPTDARGKADDEFEKAIILAASVIEWLCNRGHEVELRTANGVVGFGTGAAHMTRCRRALAQLQMIDPDPAADEFLYSGEPEVARFVVQMGSRKVSKAGTIAIPVSALDGELTHALADRRVAPKVVVQPPVGESAA
ncbi:MAG: DUF58 domain-containing protein [Candidatus Sumerlaeota bacterium]